MDIFPFLRLPGTRFFYFARFTSLLEKWSRTVIAHSSPSSLKTAQKQNGQREKIRYTMESVRHERYRWIRPRKLPTPLKAINKISGCVASRFLRRRNWFLSSERKRELVFSKRTYETEFRAIRIRSVVLASKALRFARKTKIKRKG